MNDGSFIHLQREHHRHADHSHFSWQTEAPYFARSEADLVADARPRAGERFLEIGCGEGGNLFHLRQGGASFFGIDFSPARVAFARRSTGARTAAADATALPFADESFDAVLIRDVLHHLPNRAAALEEARRVLRVGGRLTVIEPNARSPLVALQAATVRAERGLFASTHERIARELADSRLELVTMAPHQPLPIGRVLLHPRLGLDRLASVSAVRIGLESFDSLAARMIPRTRWLYLVYQAVRPEGA